MEVGVFFVYDLVDDLMRNCYIVSCVERWLCVVDLVSFIFWNCFFLKSDREVVGKSRVVGGICVGLWWVFGIGGWRVRVGSR